MTVAPLQLTPEEQRNLASAVDFDQIQSVS